MRIERSDGGGATAGRLVRPLVVLAWALAAVLAGSIVWWAVAAIGGEQGGARGRVFTQAQVTELANQPGLTGASATPSGTVSTPAATASTPSGAASGGGPTPTSGALEVPAPTAVPTQPPPAAEPVQPAPTAPPVGAPAAAARTWNVTGGQIGAQCAGTQISVLFATPQDGWTVELKHGGPDELEVKFRQGEAETSVHGVCADGVPTMITEAEHD